MNSDLGQPREVPKEEKSSWKSFTWYKSISDNKSKEVKRGKNKLNDSSNNQSYNAAGEGEWNSRSSTLYSGDMTFVRNIIQKIQRGYSFKNSDQGSKDT